MRGSILTIENLRINGPETSYNSFRYDFEVIFENRKTQLQRLSYMVIEFSHELLSVETAIARKGLLPKIQNGHEACGPFLQARFSELYSCCAKAFCMFVLESLVFTYQILRAEVAQRLALVARDPVRWR